MLDEFDQMFMRAFWAGLAFCLLVCVAFFCVVIYAINQFS